jgi:Major Facilitator Superfamily
MWHRHFCLCSLWFAHSPTPARRHYDPVRMSGRNTALGLIALVELFGMSLWFAASAVSPQIAHEWHLAASTSAWLTLAVQLGFVAGTLASALLNLPDVISSRHLIAVSAVGGGVANALLAAFAHGATSAITLRFLTGMFLAGVYPPGMKLIATWFKQGRGVALGVLIGALTLGKASPYLINTMGPGHWRFHMAIASVLAVAAALLIALFVREGPFALANQPFDPSQIRKVFGNRGVRLANFGYFGHMWELYAMWTWAPVMIRASVAASHGTPLFAEVISFVLIGSGAIGCVIAGSGACCLAVGFLFGGSVTLLLLMAIVWGSTVVADSAQFSAAVTELADPRYLGTALTIQTCIGFLITTVSIRLLPLFIDRLGWRYAFAPLALGPVLGIIAMMRLQGMRRAIQSS